MLILCILTLVRKRQMMGRYIEERKATYKSPIVGPSSANAVSPLVWCADGSLVSSARDGSMNSAARFHCCWRHFSKVDSAAPSSNGLHIHSLSRRTRSLNALLKTITTPASSFFCTETVPAVVDRHSLYEPTHGCKLL